MKRRLAAAVFVVCLGTARLAQADPRQACVAAADTGQTQRDQGKLVEARDSFVTCARDVCPTVVANHCTAWLAEVDRDLPTLSLRASDATGKELTEVQVFVDGTLKVQSLDGSVTALDPGVHHLRFVHAGDADVEQTLLVHVGDKARPVEARLGSKPGAPAPAPVSDHGGASGGFRFPLFAGVSFGVGAMSFLTMGVLVGTTASDVNHLRATCAGSCSASDVSSANTRIVLANVAMGLGIVATAAGATSLLVVNLGHHEAASSPTVSLGAGPGSVQLDGTF